MARPFRWFLTRRSVLALVLLWAIVGGRLLPLPMAAQALTQIGAESFDGLRPILKPAQDETIPANILGWTHTPPAGWSITLAPGMPQGTAEWQGWSFTTMEFWTKADLQGRELFTRAKDVFAVADPDEWDDKGNPASRGTFDSTLVSQAFTLPSISEVYVGFASHYQQEDAQLAQTFVSFDGGIEREILRYSADRINAYESIKVAVPSGARRMVVKWRLSNARNNWFWAIDDVRVADQPIVPGTPSVPDPIVLPRGPNGISSNKVLLIGIDGMRWDVLLSANAPTMQGLIANGLFAPSLLYTQPLADTSSGPGWSTIATGVWPDKHNVTSNSFSGDRLDLYPDFLTRLEQVNRSFSTVEMTDWPPLGVASPNGRPVFSSAIDVKVNPNAEATSYMREDLRIADAASRYLREQNPDAAFVYLGDVDIAGHEQGAASQRYRAAIETIDRYVGWLLNAVKARPTYAQENWLIMISTDHGHTNSGGHGGSSIEERRTFVIASGLNIPAGSRPIDTRMVDLAWSALRQLGVSINATWGLDGKPISTASTDPFDSVYNRLQSAVDETGIPATVKGWTQSPPTGWSIDNSRMTPGGVTEWRGWSFTTDEFWSRAQRDQWRELFVRGRGVIAVADPDEWDDKGSPSSVGPFDSTLISPSYPVMGGTSVTLSFALHYRPEGAQKATVVVRFNTGAQQTIANYTTEVVGRIEHFQIQVPAGATSMVIRWRLYDARNNWYWAIDNPQITP